MARDTGSPPSPWAPPPSLLFPPRLSHFASPPLIPILNHRALRILCISRLVQEEEELHRSGEGRGGYPGGVVAWKGRTG